MEMTGDDLVRILRDAKWPDERRVAAAKEILNRGWSETDEDRKAYEYAQFMSDAADARLHLIEEVFRRPPDISMEMLRAMPEDVFAEMDEMLRRLLTK